MSNSPSKGEAGTSAIVPAVTNAIFAATGTLAKIADRRCRVEAAGVNGTSPRCVRSGSITHRRVP